MGEHKLPKPPLDADTEKHIRTSRLPSARDNYENAPEGCVSESTRMWAARYADDVTLLLREIDRLRAPVAGQPAAKDSGPGGRASSGLDEAAPVLHLAPAGEGPEAGTISTVAGQPDRDAEARDCVAMLKAEADGLEANARDLRELLPDPETALEARARELAAVYLRAHAGLIENARSTTPAVQLEARLAEAERERDENGEALAGALERMEAAEDELYRLKAGAPPAPPEPPLRTADMERADLLAWLVGMEPEDAGNELTMIQRISAGEHVGAAAAGETRGKERP